MWQIRNAWLFRHCSLHIFYLPSIYTPSPFPLTGRPGQRSSSYISQRSLGKHSLFTMLTLSTFIPFLALLTGAIASFIPTPRQASDSCTDPPTWALTDFQSIANDTVGSGGRASLKLANTQTGAIDELSCSLQVNYRCIIRGTPSDANLTAHVSIFAHSLNLILDKVVQCPGRAG